MKLSYFSRTEKILWSSSVLILLLSYLFFNNGSLLNLIGSILGITAIIFIAKGNPIGQCLMIIFGLLYGYISYGFAYYGEMITYIGMTVPMAIVSLVSWLKNPYKGNKAEVAIQQITKKEWILAGALTALITVLFYFLLQWLGTSNLPLSTFSVSTSFLAVYLTYRRSPYFALAYAANDVVLVSMWIFASFSNPSYLSVSVCFLTFLVNDTYSFISWKQRETQQKKDL